MATGDLFDLRCMTFGGLLRHFRVRRMLSIRELARGAGICPSHVTMLEQGQRTPRFKSLRGLCRALGLEGDEFSIFCDAALRQSPAHMHDLPAEVAGLEEVLGPSAAGQGRSFLNANLPPVSEEETEFLRRAADRSDSGSYLVTDRYSRALPFTTPQTAPPAPAARPVQPKWRPPIRHRAGGPVAGG